MSEIYEIRDAVHGFIRLSSWERDIINQPAFQRLRRIRQLGFSEMVYPGSTHTRFEHSLGVMDVATRMFDSICSRHRGFLESELGFNDAGLKRDKQKVRLAALLHDVGHAPFSHSGEDLMPEKDDGQRWEHEDYSAAIIKHDLRDAIENHPGNENYDLRVKDITDLLQDRSSVGRSVIWKQLLSSELDADRADYLLRDSHHCGVSYGKFDLERFLATLTVMEDPSAGSAVVGVEEGGVHAAEGLILARYMMFAQVYFHRTRRAFDQHCIAATQEALGSVGGVLPEPTAEGIHEYIKWDDWRVMKAIIAGDAGRHGEAILKRNHDRYVHETPETPSHRDVETFEGLQAEFGDEITFIDQARKVPYRLEDNDVQVSLENDAHREPVTLSECSTIVDRMVPVNCLRMYAKPRDAKSLRRRIQKTQSHSGEE